MTAFSTTFRERRARAAKLLESYAVKTTENANGRYRVIHEGAAKTVYTIGYERREGEDLISDLRDAGVTILIDVRDRPFSRKPDFREKALRSLCEEAGIDYQSWRDLGSTEGQREKLKDTGDFAKFEKSFRAYATKELTEPIARLASLISKTRSSVALMCYERCHGECHRSILAEMLAAEYNFSVVAIC